MGIQSQIQHRNRLVSEIKGQEAKQLILICFLSLLLHLLFFVGIFLFHDFEFSRPKASVVRVDLVSFVPGPAGGASPAEAAPAVETPKSQANVNLNTAPVTPPQPLPTPVLKPDISLKTKPKNIKELIAARKKADKPVQKKPEKLKPKPQKNPEKELQKAREALAKKVETQNQEQINQALQRMQAAIAARESSRGEGIQGQGGGSGKKGSGPLELYKMLIASAITQNWVFNDIMAGMNQNLEVRVFIKILKNGEIRDITYETRSGNQYLDESAKKAIRRANPLPELPKGMASYDVVLGFTPKGLK